jgi:hypothetical protein
MKTAAGSWVLLDTGCAISRTLRRLQTMVGFVDSSGDIA